MNQQAVDAAAEALKSTEDFTEEVASTLLDSWAETISSIVLDAAVPYIREQIAREVEAIPNNYPAGPRNIWAKAITTAARIVRGEP